MIKAILFVICTVSVVAQELNWTPVTEAVPGGNMKRILNISDDLVVVFSDKSSYIRSDTSKVWEKRGAPNVEIIGRPERNTAEYSFVKNRNGGVVVWACAKENTTRLYYSIDTCKRWIMKEIQEDTMQGKSITLFGGIDERLYLFVENPVSHIDETTVLSTSDTAKTFEILTTLNIAVESDDIIQTSDSSIVVVTKSAVNSRVLRYKNRVWSGVQGVESIWPKAIAYNNNSIYLAAGGMIYQVENWKGKVKSYPIDVSIPFDPPRWLMRSVLRCSKNGDVMFMNSYDFGYVQVYLKKSSNISFLKLNTPALTGCEDVGQFLQQWILLDKRGVWSFNKENKLIWSSQGICEYSIYSFAINNQTQSAVAINKVGDVFYKSIKDSSPWKNITSKFSQKPLASGTNVQTMADGKIAMLYRSMSYYSADGGLEWKVATISDSIKPIEAVNMRASTNSVSIVVKNKVYLSIDGGVSYHEYVDVPNVEFIDYSLYDSNKLVFASNKEVLNIPYEGISWSDMWSRTRTHRILVNEKGTAAVIRSHHNGQYWQYSVYRKFKNQEWESSDSISTWPIGATEKILSGVIADDNTVYLTTENKMQRWLPTSSKLETIYQMNWPDATRVLILQDRALYRSEHEGLIEKCELPIVASVASSIKENSKLIVYPLPAKNSITVSGVVSGNTVTVMDLAGRIMLRQTVQGSNVQLNIAGFPVGMYFVSTENSSAMIVVEK